MTQNHMQRTEVLLMIKRRTKAAGLSEAICCHTFRATGITVYLTKGGTIEKAQQIRRPRVAADDKALRSHERYHYAR